MQRPAHVEIGIGHPEMLPCLIDYRLQISDVLGVRFGSDVTPLSGPTRLRWSMMSSGRVVITLASPKSFSSEVAFGLLLDFHGFEEPLWLRVPVGDTEPHADREG